MMENDLFTKVNFDRLKETISVEIKERIVKDVFITIDGKTFEAEDDIVVIDEDMAKMLKENGVIESAGSMRWCSRAEKGPNIYEFMKLIERARNGTPI